MKLGPKFWLTCYSVLSYPLIAADLIFKLIRRPAYRSRWFERFAGGQPRSQQGGIWFHTVSVGEFLAALPVIKAAVALWPGQVAVTCTTATGSAEIQRRLAGQVWHRYLPYDLSWAMRKFVRQLKPRVAVIVETELWPNLYAQLARQAIPLLIINARLSAKSLRGYRKIPQLQELLFKPITKLIAQSATDRDNYLQLGLEPHKVMISPNLKFDLELPANLAQQAAQLRQHWGERIIWTAASTHAGEEDLILASYQQLKAAYPDLLLVLAPRHPERFKTVMNLVQKSGLTIARHSINEPVTKQTDVYLVDSIGELLAVYAASTIALVGGSLVPVGGHNLLEPAALGLPILSGPYDFNGREVASLLQAQNGLVRITDQEELTRAMAQLIQDPQQRQALGQAAQQVFYQHQGAKAQILALLNQYMVEKEIAGS